MTTEQKKILLLPRAYMDLGQSAFDAFSLTTEEKQNYQKRLARSALQKRIEHYCHVHNLQLSVANSTHIVGKPDILLQASQRNAESRPDLIILVSKNATLLAKLSLPGVYFDKAEVFSVGRGAQVFFDEEVLTIQSARRENASGLLGLEALQDLSGKSILLCKGEQGLDELENQCRERGAKVEVINFYERRANKDLRVPAANSIEAVYGVSVFALQHLIEGLSSQQRQELMRIPLWAMSERIAAAAKEMGFEQTLVKILG